MKTLKSLLLTVALVCCGALSTHAQIGGQKFAYVDSDYILSNIPEYADAQEGIEVTLAKLGNSSEICKFYRHFLRVERVKRCV